MRMREVLSKNLAGIVASAAVGAAALLVARWTQSPLVSPLVTALVLGALTRTLFGAVPGVQDGVKFSARHALRAGIVVLGLQLSVGQVLDFGAAAALTVFVGLVTTFLLTLALGSVLGVDRRLAQLIGAGTSICGASAIMATNTVVRAAEEDVSYALACVSLFGTAAVFLFPAMGHALQLSAEYYGLWAGASIHEIGQVAAAAQTGTSAGDAAMIAKLSRVALLAPTILLLWVVKGRQAPLHGGTLAVAFPWFLLGFLALMLVGSTPLVSAQLRGFGEQTAVALLAMALAALGLDLDVRKLRSRGWRPLLLGAMASVFIAVVTLACIRAWA
jgi:uncharacterized integral membrane protein (TIGR00698 family)